MCDATNKSDFDFLFLPAVGLLPNTHQLTISLSPTTLVSTTSISI